MSDAPELITFPMTPLMAADWLGEIPPTEYIRMDIFIKSEEDRSKEYARNEALQRERGELKQKVESLEYELSLHVETYECHHCGEDTCVCSPGSTS